MNNAGIYPFHLLADLDDAAWDRVIGTNVGGTFVGSREAAKRMVAAGRGGVIVNLSSTAGFKGAGPGIAHYVAAKHAVRGLTRQMALELAPHGIRVLAVAPTMIGTEGMAAVIGVASADGFDTDNAHYSLLGRMGVTPQRNYRLSVEGIAELLDFSMRGSGNYAGHVERLLPLRRYLVGAICTIARPDAVFDISVRRDRGQWMQNERLFALNPEGRLQTKKVRPVVPVVELLHQWLTETDEWLVCRERYHAGDGEDEPWVEQIRAMSIKSSWDSARTELKLPSGWGPKLIRHSMATILLNRRVDVTELEIALGHRPLSKTTSRYAIYDPDYLSSIRDGIENVVSDIVKITGPTFTRKKHAKP